MCIEPGAGCATMSYLPSLYCLLSSMRGVWAKGALYLLPALIPCPESKFPVPRPALAPGQAVRMREVPAALEDYGSAKRTGGYSRLYCGPAMNAFGSYFQNWL